MLLLTTIQIDTFNFSEAQKDRWVEEDRISYDYLTQQLSQKISNFKFDREEYDSFLDNLKYDEKANINLGLEKLFVKDYKEFVHDGFKIGYSALNIRIDSIFNNFGTKDFENKVQNYMQ